MVRNYTVVKSGGSTLNNTGYYGMLLAAANTSVLNCEVSEVSGGSVPAFGIAFYGSAVTGGAAANNLVSSSATGIALLAGATGHAQNNLFGSTVTTQLGGGTNAGGNF